MIGMHRLQIPTHHFISMSYNGRDNMTLSSLLTYLKMNCKYIVDWECFYLPVAKTACVIIEWQTIELSSDKNDSAPKFLHLEWEAKKLKK